MTLAALVSWAAGRSRVWLVSDGRATAVQAADYLVLPARFLPGDAVLTDDAARAERIAERQRRERGFRS